ncbi:unnamed protein product [Pieris macdunnoughi]|uniref:Cytosolic beta-glucosidase n=1 Tax=Pieris macdunnoughi TaxID=345717 RepID=A0A821VPF9_9NEOP|nr:unnamed protein product [Pieris macdunnoughi]
MFYKLFIFVVCIFTTSGSSVQYDKQTQNLRTFPSDFFFGTATSAYQIEGAWNEGGKGWSMWDHLVRTDPDHVSDGTNGDVAANSYHFYKKDVEILKELGVSVYRFSIAWPRILPYGRADYVNPEGVAYYNNLINELLANDITPFVTIYHWDLPQNLNEQGGWLTAEIADWFGDYSRVLFENFGDRVKHWITINEPYIHCSFGYASGSHAPRIKSPGVGFYECGRNIILANAKAWHIYDKEFRATQGGVIGITLDSTMAMPGSNSPDDIQGAADYMSFYLGQYADPIFSATGNYPQRVIDLVAEASRRQGLNESRLVPFTQEEANNNKGTSDFFGLNHYSSTYVYRNSSVTGIYAVPSLNDDLQVGTFPDPNWYKNPAAWVYRYGQGLRKLLGYIKDTYNNPTVYITENGFGTATERNDTDRADYYREYLNGVLDAIDDGVNVKGYCAWSLIDNFEWAVGYSVRFGLYEIDQNDPEKTRKPKYSALVYKEIVRTRSVDPSYNPDLPTDASMNIKSSFLVVLVVAVLNIIW